MKYIKYFENIDTKFKVGDIVVCSTDGVYYEKYNKFKVGDMFEVIKIIQYDVYQTIKVKDFDDGFDSTHHDGQYFDGDIYPGYHEGKYFMSLEDWEIKNDSNKYNL